MNDVLICCTRTGLYGEGGRDPRTGALRAGAGGAAEAGGMAKRRRSDSLLGVISDTNKQCTDRCVPFPFIFPQEAQFRLPQSVLSLICSCTPAGCVWA